MAPRDDGAGRIRDEELARAIAQGDDGAVRAVVDAHLGRVVALAARMLGDRAEAEDVAQETFLRLWREARRWTPGAPIAPWLSRVAHNLCLDRLRRRRFQADPPGDEVPDPAPDHGATLDRQRTIAAVRAAVAALPERQRTAITLVHDLDLGNVAAAAVMAVSVEALESLLARGRRTLRDRLGERRLTLMEGLE